MSLRDKWRNFIDRFTLNYETPESQQRENLERSGNFVGPKQIQIPPKQSELNNQINSKMFQAQAVMQSRGEQPIPATQEMLSSKVPSDSQFIEQTILPITRKYNIPDAIAAGQYAAEGRQEGLGASRNNFFNINAIDQDPNQAYGYKTPEEGVEAYAKLLTEKYGDALNQKSLIEVLNAIQNAGYAGDPSTYQQRSTNPYSSYSDFVRNTPEYKYYSK